jgi:hypothetical protein
MGADPQELLPESETRFFVVSDPDVFDFQIDANGLMKKAKVQNGPERYGDEKISDAPN